MKVVISPQAAGVLRERGGHLFVWASGHVCCGGTRFIESATEAPRDMGGFERVAFDGIQLFVRPVGGRLPDELHLDLKGRRRPRVRAYWNGCAFLA